MPTIHPLATTERIEAAYARYLKTIYPFQEEDLRAAFWASVDAPGALAKGPLLEATPPFMTGRSVADLVEDGVLHRGFERLCTPTGLPYRRPLYTHQEEAVLHAAERERNLVVATGTGSGKTEAFLIPILNHLLEEQEAGTLGTPGVRALLLYPMNALVNDQLKRLRRVLATTPSITFGRYTGETPEGDEEAEVRFREQFPGEPRVGNELLSRRQMREEPPHLLITNYAMLEYLLLRPRDHAFFDSTPSFWRFLVLDEAHIYDGALGIELAMLLRRLKDRVVGSEAGRLRCIATSATLGRGRADFPDAVAFATNLFGEPFTWSEDDAERQDAIAATRVPLAQLGEPWGALPPATYRALADRVEASGEEQDGPVLEAMAGVLRAATVPPAVLERARRAASRASGESAGGDPTQGDLTEGDAIDAWTDQEASGPAREHEAVDALLYHVLRGEERLRRVRALLEDGPFQLRTLAREVLPGSEAAPDHLIALVALAARARPHPEEAPLLPARYHAFVKALEGAFACLHRSAHDDGKARVMLKRHECCPACESAVHELASCKFCGATYVVATKRGLDAPNHYRLEHVSTHGDQQERSYFLVGGRIATADEDALVAAGADEDDQGGTPHTMCSRCGVVAPRGVVDCACPGAPERLSLVELEVDRDTPPRRCLSCGARSPSSVLYRFLTGQDAPVSVLATALYQDLPPTGSGPAAALPGEGRKLLVFADSRQDAAFFAPFLNRTYARLLHRRLLLKALLEHPAGPPGHLRLPDTVPPVREAAEAIGYFTQQTSYVERQRTVRTWLMQELMALDRRQSLEGLGLLQFRLHQPAGWGAPRPLLQAPWDFSPDEAWTLIAVLLDTLRHQGALTFPQDVDPRDEAFAPRNKALYVREDQSDRRLGILSWVPTRGRNRRLDYLDRLLQARRPDLADGERHRHAEVALQGLWRHVTATAWKDHFPSTQHRRGGPVRQLSHAFWQLVPSEVGQGFVCDRCQATTAYSLSAVCPRYNCTGRLHPLDTEHPSLREDHYRRLYRTMTPVPLRAEEHTAQWTSEEASKVQERFVRGELNVLSCSTTFELGVDVGDLQAVLLRNVPPTTANYVQRAGRAGRRTDAAAFVLTFAQRRSHDLTYFGEPERMVGGQIRPPRIVLENEKIVRRHMQAVLIAAFFRQAQEADGRSFRKVASFFEGEAGAGDGAPLPTGAEALRAFAEARPRAVEEALARIVPRGLHDEVGLRRWGWLRRPQEDGLIDLAERAAAEVVGDLGEYERLQQEAAEQGHYRLAQRFQAVSRTIRKRSLIGFMASRNLLPKYGFPTDVVELRTSHLPGQAARRIQLERDLRIAVGEYAPGAEIVAAGQLWAGGGLYKLPSREWPQYEYAVCPECGRFHQSVGDPETVCAGCGARMRIPYRSRYGTFIIPEFGFVASDAIRSPGETPPSRQYASRVYFAEYAPPAADAQDDQDGQDDYEPAYAAAEPLTSPRFAVRRRYSRFGKLVVINAGPSLRGFRVCHYCGFAEPAPEGAGGRSEHNHPLTARSCSGSLSSYHLGHEFLTDVVEFEVRPAGGTPSRGLWRSLVYALLEGASDVLGIRRADLDGTLRYYESGAPPTIILFDNVPGGAGHVHRIAKHPRPVFEGALGRVSRDCCGPETSCYECLRNYYNQSFHDDLQRGAVRDLLVDLLGADGAAATR